MEVKVHNLEGQEVAHLALDPQLWEGPVNLALLSQALAMYRTNQRAGLASTKTRGDVSGGGRKPWRQKHTGRARAGSIRSPLWRHGGSTFGPHPRNVHYRLSQTIRRQALLESLKGKLRDDELILVDQMNSEVPKTKPFANIRRTFQATRRCVIVLKQPSSSLVKSLRNLEGVLLRDAASLNAFDILNAQKILVTREAFEQLESRVRVPDAASN